MKKAFIIGADHAGFKLKNQLAEALAKLGYSVWDLGAEKLDPKDDYPDFAFAVGEAVAAGRGVGLLVCGSGQGVAIAANKIPGVRAVAVSSEKEVKLAREHNDANVLCLSGWGMSAAKALKIAQTFAETSFSGAARHRRRLKKISAAEAETCHCA